MAKDTDGLLLTASLDIDGTYKKIKEEDIAKLNAKLANDNSARVKIVGGLDLNKTQSLIQSQIATIGKNLKLNIGQIDTSGFNSVQNATQNITANLKAVQTQTQTTAKSVHDISTEMESFKFAVSKKHDVDGNLITDTLKSIQNARDMFNKLGFDKLEFKWVDDAGGTFDRLKVKVTDAYNAVQEFKFFNNGSSYVYDGSSGSDSGVEKLIISTQKAQDKIKALRVSLTSDLKAIRSAWQDVNGGKSVESSENIEKLKNQYLKTAQTIRDLRNADDTTFASMKANANAQIDKLNQMVSQYHNAEKVATQLRARGFETVKVDTGNNIDKFINSINNSKVPIQAIKTEIDNLTLSFANLDNIENQADKSSALTNILNTLDNAKTKFQSLKELFKNSGNADWLTINSEQINKIDDMATKIAIYKNNLVSTREEWKSQGLYVGEIQEKAVSLARSLSGIKKPEKFDEWVNEWTALNQKATQLKANLDSQVATQNKIYEIQTKLVNLDPTKNAEEIALLNSKLQTEQKELNNLQMQSNVYSNLLSLEEQEKYITEQTAKAREQLVAANAKSEDKAVVQRIAELNSYKDSLNDVITKLNVLNNSTAFTKNSSNPQVIQIKQQISQLLTEYQTLTNTLQNENLTPADMQSVIAKFQQLDTQFKQISNSARELKSSMSAENSMQREAQNAELLIEKVKKLRAEMEAYKSANSKAMKSTATNSNGVTYSAEIDSLISKLKNASSVSKEELNKISASFRTMKAEIKSAGLEGGTILSDLWANIKKFSNWMGITMVTASIAREIRGMFTDVAELDEALIDLRKTFGGTAEDLQKFYYESNNIAKQLGITTKEVIEQASAWSRLGSGYNLRPLI